MEMECKLIKKTLVASIQGEIDLQNTDSMKERLDTLIDKNRIQNLVLNLDKVTFLDSSGLGVIIGRYKKMTGNGGRMYIVGARGGVEKILTFSGVNKIIPLYRSELEITNI